MANVPNVRVAVNTVNKEKANKYIKEIAHLVIGDIDCLGQSLANSFVFLVVERLMMN